MIVPVVKRGVAEYIKKLAKTAPDGKRTLSDHSGGEEIVKISAHIRAILEKHSTYRRE